MSVETKCRHNFMDEFFIEKIYCLEESNKCSHFCEVNDNVTQCACPDGYTLLGDEKTCVGK